MAPDGSIHDQLATGRKLRILTIVDTHSRFCPAADPRFAYRGEDVVQTLERVCRHLGTPKTIRVDNGSEFISRDLDLWAYANDVTLDVSRPGKPTERAMVRHRAEDRGERVHRGLQQQASGRVPDRASPLALGPMAHQRRLPDACRCPRTAGELAQRLQRGQTAQLNRIQRPDRNP